MEKRVRSRYFVLSGGLGGLVGFVLMEMVFLQSQGVTEPAATRSDGWRSTSGASAWPSAPPWA